MYSSQKAESSKMLAQNQQMITKSDIRNMKNFQISKSLNLQIYHNHADHHFSIISIY